MDELKLETITMIEDETLLFSLLKEGLGARNDPPAPRAPELPQSVQKTAAKVQKYLRLRERLRIKRTYLYSVARNVFLAFGENYFGAGRLERPRDIFYLTQEEVFSGNGDFKALVAERKAEERDFLLQKTYDRIVFFGKTPLPVKNIPHGNGLCGIPSGSGIVVAHVSLMNAPSDKLEPGNIILTKRTDPGWISLFPLASGLIVEHGSMFHTASSSHES